MVEPAFETTEAEPARVRGHRISLSMAVVVFCLSLLVLVSLSIYAAQGDEGTRFAPTDDNSYMDGATYVGADTCADCHDDKHDEWEGTLHSKAFQEADDTTVMAPWTSDVTITGADGEDTVVGLSMNGSEYWVDLSGNGSAMYRVDYVQGGFGWKQLFVTQIGNSKYVLPIQWNLATEEWVAFEAEDWYDEATGEPMMIATSHSWDRECAGCHVTGLEVTYNDTSTEWTATYDAPGVGCEACHGPGSLHVDPPSGEDRTDLIWNPLDSTTCGQCHVRGQSIDTIGGMTTGYPMLDGHQIRPGDDLSEYFVMEPSYHPDGVTSDTHNQQYSDYITHPHSDSLSTIQDSDHGSETCLQCHSTDFRHAEAEGEETPTVEEAQNDIECTACHDPHGSDYEHQLIVEREDTCTQCHNTGGGAIGSTPHHSQKEQVEGVIPIPEITGEPWMDGEVTCADCHMPLVAKNAVEWDIASHTYYPILPEDSLESGMPNSCTVSCHGEGQPGPTMTDQEAQDHIDEWEEEVTTLFENATADLETAKAALDAAMALGFSEADFEAANTTYWKAKLARDWVNSDGTMVHNHEFSEELLDYAMDGAADIIADLTPGTVKGMVKDGNGKAVSGAEIRIGDDVWATTGADGSFTFDIAPGDHSFDVYKGEKKERSFDSSVSAGQETDAGTVKFKKEDSSPGFGLLVTMMAVALVTLWVVQDRRK